MPHSGQSATSELRSFDRGEIPHVDELSVSIIQYSLLAFICGVVASLILHRRASPRSQYAAKVNAEFADQPLQPEEALAEADIAHLPAIVRKCITYTGAIGQPKVRNVRVRFDAEMRKAPDSAPMRATSEQYNFFGNPARMFLMKASMRGVPVSVLHAYSDQRATMQVRVAGIFDVTNISGAALSATETVTILNDMCFFAPATLIDQRLTWREIDPLKVAVRFENGAHSVAAILYFNELGELLDFSSEDRGALQDDGTLRKMKWHTPIRDYRDVRGRRLPTYGEAVWDYPDGSFAYGKFWMRDVEYNVRGFA